MSIDPAAPTAPSASTQAREALVRFGVWGVVAAAVAVHLLMAVRSVGPMVLLDEVGYVAGAEAIGRGETAWALCGESYSVGWSIPLATLWWLPISPTTVYQFAVFASAAMGAAAMWPAALLSRRVGVSARASLLVAALVTLVPARALMDNYVLAENPLAFLILWSAVLAFRAHDRGTVGSHAAFGIVLGMAAVVHSRAIPFVAIGVGWLVLRALMRRSSWSASAAGAVPAIALTAAGFFAQLALGAALFGEDNRVDSVLRTRDIRDMGLVIVGQGFTQAVSWSLLAVVGALAIASNIRGGLRQDRWRGLASPWTWLGVAFAGQALFTVFLLAGFEQIDNRLDVAIYGRYLDPFVVPLAVVGASTVWARARDRVVRLGAIVAAVAVVMYAAVVIPFLPADVDWINFNTPGLLPYLDPYQGEKQTGLLIAAGATLAGILAIYLLRRRPAVWLGLALGIAVPATVLTDALRLDPFEETTRAQTPISKRLEAEGITPEIASFSSASLPCAERNKLQMELSSYTRFVGPGETVGPLVAVGPAEWPEAEAAGMQRVMWTVWESSAIWVVPQDQ
ncbi:hypothetical protein [uncultured Demequina sp.]|uniref:hypothetical protein n=1 Tax=uncultured Demequina sp. TaxID=693499 RepID=UPI0025F8D815|nr:hypothetical protein [uncultured Demequina sp.]